MRRFIAENCVRLHFLRSAFCAVLSLAGFFGTDEVLFHFYGSIWVVITEFNGIIDFYGLKEDFTDLLGVIGGCDDNLLIHYILWF